MLEELKALGTFQGISSFTGEIFLSLGVSGTSVLLLKECICVHDLSGKIISLRSYSELLEIEEQPTQAW